MNTEDLIVDVIQPGGELVVITKSSKSELLNEFYELYDQSFVLPNEKETIDGFKECLDLNKSDKHDSLKIKHGDFVELILVLKLQEGEKPIAGANFAVYYHHPGLNVVTVALNYIFVSRDHRKKGYSRKIIKYIDDYTRSTVHNTELSGCDFMIFVEQNDPHKMSAEDYDLDTKFAGIDQFKRLAMWDKCGARLIDFEYIQPPLSESQAPDETLLLSVIDEKNDAIQPEILKSHMKAFFSISVLKGQCLEKNPVAQAQIKEIDLLIEKRKPIRLRSLVESDLRP